MKNSGKTAPLVEKLETSGRMKLWFFRIAALLLVPLLLLTLELGLRIFGFGYATSFFLKKDLEGQQKLIQNDYFGCRFFGPERTRLPEPCALSPNTPDNAVRIFVLGESAAWGDPNPEFGLTRTLDAMLSIRYPSTRFEVVNTAMTAINSHTVREIANDCARADGDIWVLYIGNNEVVGPFGSGTVFGPKVPPLAAIRTNLALKSTRTGQFVEAIIAKMYRARNSGESWGGMGMFLENQVSADDPLMEQVYANYRQNLEDIIDVGRRSGAGIVLSNVAVNLKDCAPFASEMEPGTDGSLAGQWQLYFNSGKRLQSEKKWFAALAEYAEAEKLNDRVAELYFRVGQCCLELGNNTDAAIAFNRSRDLDTLRFRADSRMQDIVRQVANDAESPTFRYVDAISAFANASPQKIPGDNFFYEHVHLKWEGNLLLAKTIAEQLQTLLPDTVKDAPDALPSWPSAQQCALRLAWTKRQYLDCLCSMRSRMQRAPFDNQMNHDEALARMDQLVKSLALEVNASPQDAERSAVVAALESTPNDTYLLSRLATLQMQDGEMEDALVTARRLTDLLPHSSLAWEQCANILNRSNKPEKALVCYERAVATYPRNFWIRHSLALTCFQTGKYDAALKEWKRVLQDSAIFGPAYLGIGEVLELQGDQEGADAQYKLAIEHPVSICEDVVRLGRKCVEKQWYQQAFNAFEYASKLAPGDASIRYEMADVLTKLGEHTAAAEQLAIAHQYDQQYWQTAFRDGLEHAREGRNQQALELFKEVIRLKPDMIQARLNLAGVLMNMGLEEEAAVHFKYVRALNPTNQNIVDYLESMGFGPEASASENE